ncbi:MAG: hypothetical protein K2F95_04745 [Alistipes sp.]|nr:hypothetical protein [Alistipes sp.]
MNYYRSNARTFSCFGISGTSALHSVCRKVSSIAAILAVLVLSGCTLTNYVGHSDIDPNRLQDSATGYKVVGHAEGRAKATYIFGIGGMRKWSREANALADMCENAELKSNQAIINVVSRRQDMFVFFPIYWRRQFITSGTIIEYIYPNDADLSADIEDASLSKLGSMPESQIAKMSASERRKLLAELQMELFDDMDYLSEANGAQARMRLAEVKNKIKLYKLLCSSRSSGYIDFEERLKEIEACMPESDAE